MVVLLAIFIFGAYSIGVMMFLVSDLTCLSYFIVTENSTSIYMYQVRPIGGEFYNLQTSWQEWQLPLSIYMLYFICAIPFLQRMLHLKTRLRSCWTHSLLVLVISASFGLWLYTYYGESGLLNVMPLSVEPEGNGNVSSFGHSC